MVLAPLSVGCVVVRHIQLATIHIVHNHGEYKNSSRGSSPNTSR